MMGATRGSVHDGGIDRCGCACQNSRKCTRMRLNCDTPPQASRLQHERPHAATQRSPKYGEGPTSR
eukprot:9220100-Alexandrium_andersonii.AAC.1